MPLLVGWRYVALIGGIVGTIALACYPIIIDPMMNPEKWKKIQAETRANIKQKDIQPGTFHNVQKHHWDMKVWTDPFDRNKAPESSK